jgi:hypothetical protein
MNKGVFLVPDLDDLFHPAQLAYMDRIKSQVPNFLCTLYTIPNRFGPILSPLREKYSGWIQFAIHGWEHSHYECLTWTKEDARMYIQKALNLGYDPIFKAPNWSLDQETEEACKDLGVVLHLHPNSLPVTPGVKYYTPKLLPHGYSALHSHIAPNPSTDWIGSNPQWLLSNLKQSQGFDFLTNWTTES